MNHSELKQKVREARMDDPDTHRNPDFALEWNAHLDTLMAILTWHHPTNSGEDYGYCSGCYGSVDWDTDPNIAIVVTALRNMGAL